MSEVTKGRSAVSAALWIYSAALLCLVLAAWIAKVIWGGVNSDAGYYIPQALLVLSGDLPYRDFPSGYPPGIYYLLALLGESGLRSPTVFKACVCIVQIANGLLVYTGLRRLGNDRLLATVFAATFAGLTTAAWGIAFELEPFQNLFVLAGFCLLLAPPHPVRGVVVGLLLGMAVLIKQYAIFAILPLVLASVTPMLQGRIAAPDLRGRSLAQVAGLLVALPVPYLLFVSLTDIDLVENLVHLATFGGRASWYGTWGFQRLLEEAATGTVGRFLLPTWILAGWLMVRHPSWRAGILILGLVLSCVPLYVRTFDYYLQPVLPWSIFVVAEFCRAVAGRFRDVEAARAIAAGLIVLPLAGIIWGGARKPFDLRNTVFDQIELARELQAEIGTTDDVLVLNGGNWLYAMTRFVPPLKDYSFVVIPEIDEARRANARFAVLFGGRPATPRLREWLLSDGMRLRRRVRWKRGVIEVLDRPQRVPPGEERGAEGRQ